MQDANDRQRHSDHKSDEGVADPVQKQFAEAAVALDHGRQDHALSHQGSVDEFVQTDGRDQEQGEAERDQGRLPEKVRQPILPHPQALGERQPHDCGDEGEGQGQEAVAESVGEVSG